MDLYFRLRNFITNWDINVDEISDLLKTLRKESIMTLWNMQKKLNGRYELYFGFDGPFVIQSEEEREALIKKIDEDYIHPKNEEK
ncbi:MAG: hypothetical protein RR202_00530 [Bacteroidales bacterium]